jgi:subtilisin-like proprotein convertase family protein
MRSYKQNLSIRSSSRPTRGNRAAIVAWVLIGLLVPLGTHAVDPAASRSDPLRGNFDVRVLARGEALRLATEETGRAVEQLQTMGHIRRLRLEQEIARLRRSAPGARIHVFPILGSAEVVSRPGVTLTGPGRGREAVQVVRDFLRENAGLYGLSPQQVGRLRSLGESAGRSGLRSVTLRQTLGGRPVFQGEARAVLDGEGRMVATVGRLVPDIGSVPPPANEMNVKKAVRTALHWARLDPELAAIHEPRGTGRASGTGNETEAKNDWLQVVVDHPDLVRPVASRSIYFPLRPGVVVPAWSHVIFTKADADWYVIAHARTGELLYRKNLRLDASNHEARFSVYVQPGGVPADSPAPASPNAVTPGVGTQFPEITRTIVQMSTIQDLVASPDGWIPDGGQTTTGNNVDAYLDQDGDDIPDLLTLDDLNGRPIGNPDASSRNRDFLGSSPRDFNYEPAPSGGDPDAGDEPYFSAPARGILTQLFYTANYVHDVFHELGFDEASGNFQHDNFGRGGLAGDRLLAGAQWGALVGQGNNAFFVPTPDGVSSMVRMYLWTHASPWRDSVLDVNILVHELAHGVTNRIIGDAAGLNWGPGLALGEGWSDFYALAILNNQPGEDPNGRYSLGPYASYLFFGIFIDNYVYGLRRFPYSTVNTINPLTWADVDEIKDDLSGGMAISPLGLESSGAWELHNAGELWGLSLWEVRSRIIAANGGNVPLGNNIAMQIVTDALKLTPIDPSFTQARDALLVADCAANGCANEESIWGGFADRGLGYGSDASLGIATRVGVRESFSLPYLDVGQVTVDDSSGNGNGCIDPGESFSITIELLNPWQNAAKGVGSVSAALQTSSPAVSISDSFASYGALPAQGAAAGEPFSLTVDAGVTCGQSLELSVETTSTLGTTSVPVPLRVGQPVGPGVPVVYTRTISGGLSIPEADVRGVFDTMNVADNLEIVDLDLRIDDLEHTAVGDLSIHLRAPSGFGADLIFRMPDCDEQLGCRLGLNAGDNLINTVIDDDATGDLMAVTASAAPFTGSWIPAFNSPEWIPNDTVGQMSRYAGASTQGDWQLLIADNEIFDTGQLNGWSLIVTPMAYSCDCDPYDSGVNSVPAEVTGVEATDAVVTLIWDSSIPGSGSATVHDVLRGDLDQLPVGTGSSETCLLNGASVAAATDSSMPSPGNGHWYLIRGRNACGTGPYGLASNNDVRAASACAD